MMITEEAFIPGIILMSERIITICGFCFMIIGLIVLGYQNVRIAQMLAELGVLIIKTH